MDGAGHHGRRPRPVADAPWRRRDSCRESVAARARGRCSACPGRRRARRGAGPWWSALCSGVLVALGSDAELERLVGGADRALLGAAAARLTGARTAAGLAAGVEALRAATWRALRAELRDPVPELVADLADRLAYVCACVTEASLSTPLADAPGRSGPLAEALSSVSPAAEPPRPEPAAPRHEGIRAFAPAPPSRDDAPAPAPAPDPDPDEPPAPPPAGVQVVDLPARPADLDPLTSLAEELAAAPPTGVAGAPSHDAMYAPAADAPTVTRLRRVDTSWEDVADAGLPWLARSPAASSAAWSTGGRSPSSSSRSTTSIVCSPPRPGARSPSRWRPGRARSHGRAGARRPRRARAPWPLVADEPGPRSGRRPRPGHPRRRGGRPRAAWQRTAVSLDRRGGVSWPTGSRSRRWRGGLMRVCSLRARRAWRSRSYRLYALRAVAATTAGAGTDRTAPIVIVVCTPMARAVAAVQVVAGPQGGTARGRSPARSPCGRCCRGRLASQEQGLVGNAEQRAAHPLPQAVRRP